MQMTSPDQPGNARRPPERPRQTPDPSGDDRPSAETGGEAPASEEDIGTEGAGTEPPYREEPESNKKPQK
jgi:hypothetical protein